MRQALQRMKKSGLGSSRLRLPSVPIRTPILKRASTTGSAATNNNNQDTPPPPPSHRSTKSTGSVGLTHNVVVARVDHLRRLAFRRLIQSGLIWERLDDSPRHGTSRDLVSSEDDDVELDQSTVRGMELLIQPQQIETQSARSSSCMPLEETKEPEAAAAAAAAEEPKDDDAAPEEENTAHFEPVVS